MMRERERERPGVGLGRVVEVVLVQDMQAIIPNGHSILTPVPSTHRSWFRRGKVPRQWVMRRAASRVSILAARARAVKHFGDFSAAHRGRVLACAEGKRGRGGRGKGEGRGGRVEEGGGRAATAATAAASGWERTGWARLHASCRREKQEEIK